MVVGSELNSEPSDLLNLESLDQIKWDLMGLNRFGSEGHGSDLGLGLNNSDLYRPRLI